MKFLFGLALYLFFSTTSAVAQSTCEKATDMIATIKAYHYEARPIDSNYCEQFCDILVDKVDAYGLFLTSVDVSTLRSSSYTLINELENEECSFYEKFASITKERIESTRTLLSEYVEKPFKALTKDSIRIDRGKYFVSPSALPKRWSKWLQYLTLKRIESKDLSSSQLDSIYQNVISLEQCRLDSYFINNSLDTKISEWYLTSLANTFDPHTTYFSSDGKESFYGGLSDEQLSFGIELDRTERGQLEVSAIVPGGAAWNSNQINEGAILTAVIANNETKDFSCIRYSEAINFLNSSKVDSARFIFESEKSVLDTVKLVKTKITVQENIVQSFILSDSSQSIGYIYLPSFYTSENLYGLNTNGCSADISREIIRLKDEGIDALIIDLRGNGGGHMLEAINLIGIFINYGTLGVLDGDGEKSSLIKDMNRGLIYNGPLTVMIDEYSASASEFFAVTLQDYNRALIVGSTSYGKSTAQTVMPIEAHRYLSPELMDFEPQNFVKLTINRFYRVNGDTYQHQGVIPDIVLPSFLDGLEIGEKSQPTALQANHIERKTYFNTPFTLPREKIQESFAMRNVKNPYFELVKDVSKRYKAYWESSVYPIDINSENKLLEDYYKGLEKFYAFEVSTPFQVNNPAYLAGYSNQLDSDKEINEWVMKDIKDDNEIIEAFKITIDLINIKNKK